MDKFRELPAGKALHKGKYIVERVLGMGGFGITYYAKHVTLHKYYAIKEFFINGSCMRNTQTSKVHLQGITEEIYINFKQKFIEEAQILASLEHENIVKVIDVFEENNTSYIVMPFIEGITLQQLVNQKGKLDYEMAVNYIAQISEAIGYIHSLTPPLLHRDIAPDNVIITPENRIVLIDFGSAREFVNDKTQHHTTILKKGYAPLEQYSANSRKGAYSDIYSLGATFYFALTGQKPMDATERTIENMPEPKTLSASIPEDANRTIVKAMSLKPENRHQNINEFMDDLLGRKEVESKNGKKKTSKFIWIGIALLFVVLGTVLFFLNNGKSDNLVENNQPQLPVQNVTDSIVAQTPLPKPPPETILKQNTDWIIQYEQAFTEANNLFKRKDYKNAKRKYQNVLSIIPQEDKSDKKAMIEKKIADCDRNIKAQEDEQLKQEETKEKERRLQQETQKRQQEEDEKQQLSQEKDMQIKETLSQANSAFNSGKYAQAFDLYKKAKELGSNDNTGYAKFKQKAMELFGISGECDANIKKLLGYAQALNNTSEIRQLLSNCN